MKMNKQVFISYKLSPEESQKVRNFVRSYHGKIYKGRMDLLYRLFEYLKLEENGVSVSHDSVDMIALQPLGFILVLRNGWIIEEREGEVTIGPPL